MRDGSTDGPTVRDAIILVNQEAAFQMSLHHDLVIHLKYKARSRTEHSTASKSTLETVASLLYAEVKYPMIRASNLTYR